MSCNCPNCSTPLPETPYPGDDENAKRLAAYVLGRYGGNPPPPPSEARGPALNLSGRK